MERLIGIPEAQVREVGAAGNSHHNPSQQSQIESAAVTAVPVGDEVQPILTTLPNFLAQMKYQWDDCGSKSSFAAEIRDN